MIRPPSDIVLDVARAADPARLAQAQARLGAAAGDAALALAGSRPTNFDLALRQISAARPTQGVAPAPPDATRNAYRGLEEVLLSRLVEAMLPKDAPAVYGAGGAGRVWRGFFAEQIARSVAQSGGVGVADRLAPRQPGAAPA